ncbi:hypothetical protein L210DRAFT_1060834 [Boletus edulis BED1]|uniref:Uncharacterized protein n=1 Tax=Boletus edulis BED1 TaxID=1328754 RepID=A0AAD4G6L9_BOLED|nr:hypothetical protein L210DRAFT_1060834 [Boletus edulis BED1]
MSVRPSLNSSPPSSRSIDLHPTLTLAFPSHQTVTTLMKTSLSPSDSIHITTALFYCEDGTIDQTPVLMYEDSWKELDDLKRPSTGTHSSHSTTLSASETVISSGFTRCDCDQERANSPFKMTISIGDVRLQRCYNFLWIP